MAAPTTNDLATYVGQAVNEDQAEAVIAVVSALAASYTRGAGFTDGVPADDLWAVILSASARRLADTSGIVGEERMGPFAVSYQPNSGGWSTSELVTLNRYRQRAW